MELLHSSRVRNWRLAVTGAHLIAPPEVGVAHESEVSQFALKQLVSFLVYNPFQQDVQMVEIFSHDLLQVRKVLDLVAPVEAIVNEGLLYQLAWPCINKKYLCRNKTLLTH